MSNARKLADLLDSTGDVKSGALDNVPVSDTATTQSVSDNSTKIATTAYTDAQVATIVDSAPGTLNTLNELAAALGDDANFSTTTATNIAAKLPLAGGTMTGALDFGDNVKANFGASDDLQIWHEAGVGSYIKDAGEGQLFLQGSDWIVLEDTDGNNMVACQDGAAVTLYHNGAAKLATTSTGVDITGVITTDGVTVGDGTGSEEITINKGASSNGTLSFDSGGSTSAYIKHTVYESLELACGAGNHNFLTGGGNIERMRLTTAGDLHVDGDVIAYSTTVSDERLKENIQPIEDALNKVNQLKGCTFTYTPDGKQSAGLIAQDVEKVLPSAVTEKELPLKQDDGKEYKVLQYDQTIGLLVEAIKELTDKVEKLEAR